MIVKLMDQGTKLIVFPHDEIRVWSLMMMIIAITSWLMDGRGENDVPNREQKS